MCSFSGSQDPIASAQCFKSAPNSLDHGMSVFHFRNFFWSKKYYCVYYILLLYCVVLDDAARMCTDIPSAEVSMFLLLLWNTVDLNLLWLLFTIFEYYDNYMFFIFHNYILIVSLFMFVFVLKIKNSLFSTCNYVTEFCRRTGEVKKPLSCVNKPRAGTR